MRAVLDTNVLVSGIFFGGLPRLVLDAWADQRFELVLSPLIFDEYQRTCDRLAVQHSTLAYPSILTTLIGHGTLVSDTIISEPITSDPDDDKFLLCALTAQALVVSGDRHLLDAKGWRGINVLTPRDFLQRLDECS